MLFLDVPVILWTYDGLESQTKYGSIQNMLKASEYLISSDDLCGLSTLLTTLKYE